MAGPATERAHSHQGIHAGIPAARAVDARSVAAGPQLRLLKRRVTFGPEKQSRFPEQGFFTGPPTNRRGHLPWGLQRVEFARRVEAPPVPRPQLPPKYIAQ